MTGEAVSAAVPPVRRRDNRNVLEFATGVVVLVLLACILVLAVVGNGRKTDTGYRVTAQFSHVDGLSLGSDVRLAGVTVGTVLSEGVDPKTYQANIVFTVRSGIRLPTDSSAVITSDSLLGGKYIALQPGGTDAIIKPGGRIGLTQGSISLEQLLSKFIFSVTDAMAAKKPQPAGTPPVNGAGTPAQP